VLEYSLDFRQGGVETTRSRFPEGTPFPGTILQNDVVIQEIQPDRRIVQTGAMSLGGRRFSVSLVTFEFLEEDGGTTLVCTDQIAFLEGADGPELREGGWRELFGRLAAVLAE